mmetsp:Transcript_5991/g.8793  ORF Transcript_5991/g.8793 Transcript_5991/m.8793 type:complete len:384 (-) Transcript_5991:71-1222(-)
MSTGSVKTKRRAAPQSEFYADSLRCAIRRRSSRGNSSLSLLAHAIADNKNVLFLTGAGLSVNSGIKPFRGDNGVWEDVLWSNATRSAFRRTPLEWYNDFWLQYFPPDYDSYTPNSGHEALAQLASIDVGEDSSFSNGVRIITQNVDGLHSRTRCKWDNANKLIEAHGKVGLYKCIPDEDSDSDDDSDDEEKDRPVKLGSRRKYRAAYQKYRKEGPTCPFEVQHSISADKLLPFSVRDALSCSSANNATSDDADQCNKSSRKIRIDSPPLCPSCSRPCMPQSLLFDEGYHSHSYYQFEKIEDWISNYADVMVFVGTSFSVTITDVAVRHAMEKSIPVYNFNLHERVNSSARLNVENIMGDSSETLVELLSMVESIRLNRTLQHE